MIWTILGLLAILLSLLPWVLVGVVFAARREIRELRERIDRLERSRESGRPADSSAAPRPVTPQPVAPQHVARPEPSPIATPVQTPAPVVAAPRRATDAASVSAPRDPNRLETQVGGIWMQNVGSVLLLLGAFFLIVWGYANGRIGPEVLVLAGVLLGLVTSWRGNVIARSIPPLGNALIGVGLGVVYITLYLGHFRMHVLSGWAAFASLVFVALSTVAIGLRRREPIIATLGVVGAFLPQLLAAWVPLHGFHLALPALLGYFAVVNAVVFTLAATVGWSGLAILSMVLTTGTWSANASSPWSLGIEMGLATLFTALGLAPVVRLARSEKPVRGVDLAVVALAPMFLLLGSAPFLAGPDRVRAAALLGGLAAVYVAVSIWIDGARTERDLWKPLTAAATILLAGAIERGLLPRHLAIAWCAEGAALVWLGLRRRGSWLRMLGYGVLALAAVRLFTSLVSGSGVPAGSALLLGPTALRDLVCIAALVALSHFLGRNQMHLTPEEGSVPGLAVIAANLLLALWIVREAVQLRWFLPGLSRGGTGTAMIAGTAWLFQALVLVTLARSRHAAILRQVGYGAAFIGSITLLVVHSLTDPWRPGDPPLLNANALVVALGIVLLIAIAEILWRTRSELEASERPMPEVAAIVANFLLLFWWSMQSSHLAWTIEGGASDLPDAAVRTLAAVIASAGWTVQAVALFAIGWLRGSAFLRWCGLGLFGLTVLKFLVVDLNRVDSFWRFVSALGIGAALLVVSFLYQRRARRSATPVAESAEAP